MKKVFIYSLMLLLLAAGLLINSGCSKKNMVESDVVRIKTNMGNIEITLNPAKAPLSVENFKAYVRAGFYNNTVVHRIVNKGMYLIQAGGLSETGIPKNPILPPIPCESDNGLKNKTATIGYGRRGVPDPATATSHFYINYKDNPGFDHADDRVGYAVFGDITKGLDVVEKIANLEALPNSWPAKTVLIKSADIVMIPGE